MKTTNKKAVAVLLSVLMVVSVLSFGTISAFASGDAVCVCGDASCDSASCDCATDDATKDATEDATKDATDDATDDATKDATDDATDDIYGDVNCDGAVDIKDVTALLRYLVKLDVLDEVALANADANCDGDVNIKDVTAILKWIVSLYDDDTASVGTVRK